MKFYKKMSVFACAATYLLLNNLIASAFSPPKYINVNKPSPSAVKTVCASGCDFASLEAADSVAQPGWLIKMKAGTYSDTTWDSSGTSGNEIVIEAYGDGDVVINSSGVSRFYLNGSYVIIDGLESRSLIFDGSAQNDNGITIYPSNASSHNTLSRLQVRNSFGSGANVQPRGDYFKLYNSEIYGSGSVGVYGANGDFHEIRNNVIHDNLGSGIQYNPHTDTDACDEVVIAGNAIYNNGKGGPAGDRPGIAILSNDNDLYDIYIYNNIIWDNQSAGLTVGSNSNINARIYNNSIYINVIRGLLVYNSGTVDIRNNIVFSNGTNEATNWIPTSWGSYYGPDCATCLNNLTSSPSFLTTDQSIPTFLFIDKNSAAFNTGTDVPITDSYNGSSRSLEGAVDIGAFEYGLQSPIITNILLK